MGAVSYTHLDPEKIENADYDIVNIIESDSKFDSDKDIDDYNVYVKTGNTGKIDWVKAATSTTVTADKKIDLTLKVKDGADTDADSRCV